MFEKKPKKDGKKNIKTLTPLTFDIDKSMKLACKNKKLISSNFFL